MSTSGDFAIRVEAIEGPRGEAVPLRFSIGGRQVEVAEIVDRWIGADRRYFKVLGDDGDIYILRYEPLDVRWELTLYSSASALVVG